MPIRKWLTAIATAASMLAAPALAGSAWQDARQARFDEWRAANPDLPDRIADLKARTAQKIADYRQSRSEADHKWREHQREQ